jgi:O-antigen ligase
MIGLFILLGYAWGDIAHRFEVGFNQEHVAGGRGDLWLAAWHAYEDNPLVGIGYGAFHGQSFQLLRTTPGVNLEEHLRFIDSGEYVHNTYLGSLAELGPLGLVAFVGILYGAAKSLRATGRRGRGRDDFAASCANALFVSLLAFCVSSVFLSTETSRSLWLMVGLSIALPSIQERAMLESRGHGDVGRRTRP